MQDRSWMQTAIVSHHGLSRDCGKGFPICSDHWRDAGAGRCALSKDLLKISLNE